MSRSTQSPVPRLDLAPKLNRPLSLWNPLDYLRLLYWVFYFPQALRWYVDRYGGDKETGEEGERAWLADNWQRLRKNPVRMQFCLQGLLLTIITPLFLCKLMEVAGVEISWFGMASGLTFGITFSMMFILVFSKAFGTYSDTETLMSGIASGGISFGVASGISGGTAVGAACGLMMNVVLGVSGGVAIELAIGSTLILTSALIFIAVGSFTFGSTYNAIDIALYGLVFGMVSSLAIFRPETWLVGVILGLGNSSSPKFLASTTYLPFPFLSRQLRQWLQQDWEAGIDNIDQLLTYTLQFIPVIRAMNRVLVSTSPDCLVPRIAQLAAAPFDWSLIYFASADLGRAIQNTSVEGVFFLPPRWKRLFQERLDTTPRLDTSARATAAGFWYLYQEFPAEAATAFGEVRNLPYGEEMYRLSIALSQCLTAKTLIDIAALQMDLLPAETLLRPTTWNAISRLQRVVSDVQIVQQSFSRLARSSALARAIRELTTLLQNINEIPQAEQDLINSIATTWEDVLQNVAGQANTVVFDQLIVNPYVVGDPVIGSLFVGRDDILKRLEELWFIGPQMQSVVLYGHRRMGKTSILRNMEHRLGSDVKIAYVNSLSLGNVAQGVAEVLMAISDAIADVVDLPAPADADLLNLPYLNFGRFIKQVEKALDQKRLIIALDEFEKIESLIQTGQISEDFWQYLRELVQKSPKIALAFAGLHTLDETIGNYQHPFFASIIPIPVRFLDLGSTQLLLEDPSDEFPLTYAPEVLHQIHDLTAGQPHLVQLIGFQLVRRYNDQVFSQGRTRDPRFNVDDLEAVIQDPEFFNQGRYYFAGVWGQANQDAPGQQAILRALAPHPPGLDLAELMQITGFTETQLTPALATLKKHDVIQQTQNKWQIIVELFRRWVIDHT